jgi:uncharacterized RDD family membrane protein YckC
MSSTASTNASALIGWRMLALFYDLWPAAALWLAVSALFTWLHRNQPLAAFSAAQLALWASCWAVTGAYAVTSWRRGGQTLGMRPWRLRVVAAGGERAGMHALVLRYLVGTLSLLAGGLGFWWAWVDRDGLTWHDRASATRMVRAAKDFPQ